MKYNPSLRKKVSKLSKGKPFSFWKFYYVDDTAFVFLSRKDIEEASRLIKSHFARFGLTVHCGDKKMMENRKLKQCITPHQGKQQQQRIQQIYK